MRFISLKTRIFVERGVPRITNRLAIDDLLVLRLAGIRLAQVSDPLGLGIGDQNISVAVNFLAPTVMQLLFLLVFRALATPFRAINDEGQRFALLPFVA